MRHADNLADFDTLAELLERLGVREWSIDLPSSSGRFADATAVDPRTAGALLNRSYGGAVHEPLADYACGAHLAAVLTDGSAARCGFYADRPVGQIGEGLADRCQCFRYGVLALRPRYVTSKNEMGEVMR